MRPGHCGLINCTVSTNRTLYVSCHHWEKQGFGYMEVLYNIFVTYFKSMLISNRILIYLELIFINYVS